MILDPFSAASSSSRVSLPSQLKEPQHVVVHVLPANNDIDLRDNEEQPADLVVIAPPSREALIPELLFEAMMFLTNAEFYRCRGVCRGWKAVVERHAGFSRLCPVGKEIRSEAASGYGDEPVPWRLPFASTGSWDDDRLRLQQSPVAVSPSSLEEKRKGGAPFDDKQWEAYNAELRASWRTRYKVRRCLFTRSLVAPSFGVPVVAPNGLVFSNDTPREVTVRFCRKGKYGRLTSFQAHAEHITGMKYIDYRSGIPASLYTCSLDGTARRQDPVNGNPDVTYTIPPTEEISVKEGVVSMDIAPELGYVILGTEGTRVAVFDEKSGALLASIALSLLGAAVVKLLPTHESHCSSSVSARRRDAANRAANASESDAELGDVELEVRQSADTSVGKTSKRLSEVHILCHTLASGLGKIFVLRYRTAERELSVLKTLNQPETGGRYLSVDVSRWSQKIAVSSSVHPITLLCYEADTDEYCVAREETLSQHALSSIGSTVVRFVPESTAREYFDEATVVACGRRDGGIAVIVYDATNKGKKSISMLRHPTYVSEMAIDGWKLVTVDVLSIVHAYDLRSKSHMWSLTPTNPAEDKAFINPTTIGAYLVNMEGITVDHALVVSHGKVVLAPAPITRRMLVLNFDGDKQDPFTDAELEAAPEPSPSHFTSNVIDPYLEKEWIARVVATPFMYIGLFLFFLLLCLRLDGIVTVPFMALLVFLLPNYAYFLEATIHADHRGLVFPFGLSFVCRLCADVLYLMVFPTLFLMKHAKHLSFGDVRWVYIVLPVIMSLALFVTSQAFDRRVLLQEGKRYGKYTPRRHIVIATCRDIFLACYVGSFFFMVAAYFDEKDSSLWVAFLPMWIIVLLGYINIFNIVYNTQSRAQAIAFYACIYICYTVFFVQPLVMFCAAYDKPHLNISMVYIFFPLHVLLLAIGFLVTYQASLVPAYRVFNYRRRRRTMFNDAGLNAE